MSRHVEGQVGGGVGGVEVRGRRVVPVTVPLWLPEVRIGKASLTFGIKSVGRAMFSVPTIAAMPCGWVDLHAHDHANRHERGEDEDRALVEFADC